MRTLGEEVRQRRRELHLGQEEVADLEGVSPSFVRFVEHDKPTLRLDKMRAVLTVLGLEITVTAKST